MSRSGSLNYKTHDGSPIASELFIDGGYADLVLVGGTGGVISQDLEDTIAGNAASVVLTNTAGSTMSAKVVLPAAIDTTTSTSITIAVKTESQDDYSAIKSTGDNALLLYLNDGGVASGAVFFSVINYAGEGWSLITIYKSDFTGTQPDWSAIDWMQFTLKNVGDPNSISIKIGGVWFGKRQRPKLVITFDDFHESVPDLAYPFMLARDLQASCFINSTTIGNAVSNRGDLSDCHTLYDNGWDILNHSSEHNSMIDNADWQAELQAGKDYLTANGFTRGSNIMAPPGGQYDTTGTEITKAMGYEWMRGVDGTDTNLSEGASKRYNFPGLVLQDTVTLQDAKDYVDGVIEKGVTGCTYIHIVENPETANGWDNTAKFQPWIDYVKFRQDQGLIDVVVFSDLIKLKHERYGI